jgi:hypothetical protein
VIAGLEVILTVQLVLHAPVILQQDQRLIQVPSMLGLISDSLLGASVAFAVAAAVKAVVSQLNTLSKMQQPTYSERMGKLAESLTKSSEEVDAGWAGAVVARRNPSAA